MLELFIVLARRRKTVLYATAVSAVMGVALALCLPNRYTATASILPPQQSSSLASSVLGQLGGLGPMAMMAQKDLGLKNPNDMYVGMLKSRTVEDALIRRFELLEVYRDSRLSTARTDLEKASSIVSSKEGFIAISVEDRDRTRAMNMANAYVEQLRKLTQDLAVTEASQRRLFFGQQLELAKNNLADAEQALKATEQKTGLIQLEGQAKAIIEAVIKLRASIASKEAELHVRRSFSTEQNPDLVLAEQEVAGLREQLTLLERHGGGDGDFQVAAGKVPEAGLEYVRKLREVKYCETIFELLAKQYEAARLDESKSAAVIQILDPAVEPDQKSSPRRSIIVVTAFLLGLIVSAGFALVCETFCRAKSDAAFKAQWIALRSATVAHSS